MADAALPPGGVVESVAAVHAASGSFSVLATPDPAMAGADWGPAYGMAVAVGRGRNMWKHRVWHKRDCRIVEGWFVLLRGACPLTC